MIIIIIIIIIIKNEKIRVTLCENAAEALYIVNNVCDRSKDSHLPLYPLKVDVLFSHNHTVNTAAALRWRDVSPEVRDKFIKLLRDGHSPATALQTHHFDLQLQHGVNYLQFAADRRHCPDKMWCYRLGQKWNLLAIVFTSAGLCN